MDRQTAMLDLMTTAQELFENNDGYILVIANGVLENLGAMPAANFRYTDKGTAMFRGNVKTERPFTSPSGESFTATRNIPLVAWQEEAEDLMDAQQGDEIFFVGEYTVRKGTDNRYYPEVRVIKSYIITE